MPARSGHAHSEDLPWLEVPHPVPAAEEESDSGVSLVPPICGEAPFFFSAGMRSRQRIKQNGKTESCIRCFQAPIFSPFFFHLTATKEVPEDQERHHFGAVLHQRMAGAHLHVHCSESSVAGTNYDRNDCLLVIFPLGP